MNIKDALIESASELLSMFSINIQPCGQNEEEMLTAANEVNILIGITNGMKGNIILGMSLQSALKVVSGMTGGSEISDLDLMAKSALGELTNMLAGKSFSKITAEIPVELSPPTLATGENMLILLSRVATTRLLFKISDNPFEIAYSIE